MHKLFEISNARINGGNLKGKKGLGQRKFK